MAGNAIEDFVESVNVLFKNIVLAYSKMMPNDRDSAWIAQGW